MAEDDVWELFVESLWRYQYVQKLCPLKPELCHALYEVTQGITDFAVKVYMLAQIRAIATEKETVTESIIRSVAKDSLRLAQPILSALKTGDIKFLQSVEDVYPIDLTSFIQEASKSTKVVGKIRSSPVIQKNLVDDQEDISINAQNLPVDSSMPESANITDIATPTHTEMNKKQRKSRNTASENDGLVKVVALGAKKRITAYEALKLEGYIRSATEYLKEEMLG
jgi:hypothetical protein